MNVEINCFDFEGQAVRVFDRDGSPWFVAADACRVLEIANPSDAIKALDGDEKFTLDNAEGNPRAGVPRVLNLVSESGLYALIFKSRKPEAKKFRKWVTSEVLPALRENGRYEVPADVQEQGVVSILQFVEMHCGQWSLERQMEFGNTVRRYAKAMGVVFQTVEDPGMGRVFAFPRQLMDRVRSSCVTVAILPDSDAVELEKLLDALLMHHESGTQHPQDVVRGTAKQMGIMKRIFGPDATVSSERSAFGKLCERFNGYVFPSGCQLMIRRRGESRLYEVNRIRQGEGLRMSA